MTYEYCFAALRQGGPGRAAGPLLLVILVLALGLPYAGAGLQPSPQGRHAGTAAAPQASTTLHTGRTFYLEAQLGLDPRTGRAPADLATETRLLMEAVQRTVAAAGLRMDELVSVTVISTDANLDGDFDAAFNGYFQGRGPARSFVAADALAGGAHFELVGIALRAPRLQP
jgi:2-iminobutanoate/2-iminopropanoate deaminase